MPSRTVKFVLLLLVLVCCFLPTSHSQQTSSVEERVNSLLARMTLEEKLGQLQQLDGGAQLTSELQRAAMNESRLKIPVLFGFDVIHGYRTIFPIPLGEAASFDPSAAERSAYVAATEARGAGGHRAFAPLA